MLIGFSTSQVGCKIIFNYLMRQSLCFCDWICPFWVALSSLIINCIIRIGLALVSVLFCSIGPIIRPC